MVELVLSVIPAMIFGVCSFATIDAIVGRRRRKHAPNPLAWLALAGYLFALDPGSKISYLAAGLAIAGLVWYTLYRGAKKRQPRSHPEALLLEFCVPGSVALAGALSALFIALYLYSLGLLGDVEYWSAAGAWKLIAFPFAGGAIVALLRRGIRRWKPAPVSMPYGVRWGMGDSHTWAEGKGLWLDEIILPVVLTPFLWAALQSVDLGWSSFFIFGLVFPTAAFYFLWGFVDRFWLRLVGVVDRRLEMDFLAYEALISEPDLAQWLGDLVVAWNGDGFVVSGALPGRQELARVRKALEELAPNVDVSEVSFQPELIPNPRLQLALAKRRRRLQQSA